MLFTSGGDGAGRGGSLDGEPATGLGGSGWSTAGRDQPSEGVRSSAAAMVSASLGRSAPAMLPAAAQKERGAFHTHTYDAQTLRLCSPRTCNRDAEAEAAQARVARKQRGIHAAAVVRVSLRRAWALGAASASRGRRAGGGVDVSGAASPLGPETRVGTCV